MCVEFLLLSRGGLSSRKCRLHLICILYFVCVYFLFIISNIFNVIADAYILVELIIPSVLYFGCSWYHYFITCFDKKIIIEIINKYIFYFLYFLVKTSKSLSPLLPFFVSLHENARRRMRFLWRSGPVGGTRWPTYGRLKIEVDALPSLFPFSDLFIIGGFDLSLSSRNTVLLDRHVRLGNFYHTRGCRWNFCIASNLTTKDEDPTNFISTITSKHIFLEKKGCFRHTHRKTILVYNNKERYIDGTDGKITIST